MNIEESIHRILVEFEEKISLCWIKDGDDEFFDDFTNEILEDCKDQITDLMMPVIRSLESGEIEFKDIPKLVSSKNILEFRESLQEFSEIYPMLYSYVETLEVDYFHWEPLYEAIRVHFVPSTVLSTLNRREFLIALKGYANLETINFDTQAPLLKELQLLKQNIFARFDEIQAIDELINFYLRPKSMSPTPVSFVGSTGGLENDLSKWIRSINVLLFDEEDLDFSENNEIEENLNLEGLKTNWLEKDASSTSMFDGYYWKVIDANAEVELELGDKSSFTTFHVLSQIYGHNLTNDDGEMATMEKYKVTLLRTGVREEYSFEMDRSLLALQMVIINEQSGIPFENIEGEIAWLRLKEDDYPLVGFDENQIRDVSRLFLDSQ